MNWGVKIFLTLLVFIIVAVSTGVYMVSQDHDSLVEDDYYEKGLTYDSEYDHKTNVEVYQAEPSIEVEGDKLVVSFQQAGNAGTIHLQRASDSSLDEEYQFSTQSKIYALPISDLSGGKWKVLINWEHNKTPFMHEEIFNIP